VIIGYIEGEAVVVAEHRDGVLVPVGLVPLHRDYDSLAVSG
jgi:hypothetical protein